MPVSGTINVNLSAIDTHTEEGIESEKKSVLSSANSLSSAVVAVASGTCGTTAVNVDFSAFRGADGNLVDFAGINGFNDTLRVAFAANPAASLKYDSGDSSRELRLHSGLDIPAVSLLPRYPDTTYTMSVQTLKAPMEDAYTASYTVLMLKDAIEYPLRALAAGGLVRYSLGGVTNYVSPTYDITGLASPTYDVIAPATADLLLRGSSSSGTSVDATIQPALDAYEADNPSAVFLSVSIEIVLVDARNIIFGWGVGLSATLTLTAHVFPEITGSWVTNQVAQNPLYPITPYLPLRPYRKLF